MDAPKLIESNIKNVLFNTLSKCHGTRVQIYYIVLNLIVFIAFMLITGTILYYCYKKKPTDYESRQKLLKDQEYVLSKIRFYQGEQLQKTMSNITNLPMNS
jgi:hypothetical protein